MARVVARGADHDCGDGDHGEEDGREPEHLATLLVEPFSPALVPWGGQTFS